MKTLLSLLMTAAIALALSACAGPKSGGDDVVTVDIDSEGPALKTPAERVYDPHSYTYHWERDGVRVSGKYD